VSRKKDIKVVIMVSSITQMRGCSHTFNGQFLARPFLWQKEEAEANKQARLVHCLCLFAPASPPMGRVYERALFECIQSEKSKRRDSYKPTNETAAADGWSFDCWISQSYLMARASIFLMNFQLNVMRRNLNPSACLVRSLETVRCEFLGENQLGAGPV